MSLSGLFDWVFAMLRRSLVCAALFLGFAYQTPTATLAACYTCASDSAYISSVEQFHAWAKNIDVHIADSRSSTEPYNPSAGFEAEINTSIAERLKRLEMYEFHTQQYGSIFPKSAGNNMNNMNLFPQ